ncbi:hypothetical protein AGOR_G00217570 [Albula goreensis]|uniref:Histone-lysine N-methyltransferase SETDB2 n=1 Tax=Albula goreensis TaxID=1534307 RepID=A0A8T3CPI8_9TELE|nr:hypothetical protein AGOR_G00217570 [Albula goreensis]
METITPLEIEKAKDFWRDVDVDSVFEGLCDYLQCLRERIKDQSATDRELILGLNIILASELLGRAKSEIDYVEEILISSEVLPVAGSDGDTVEQEVEGESTCEQEVESLLLHDNSRCIKSQPCSPDPPLSPPQSEGDGLQPPTWPSGPDTVERLASPSPSEPDSNKVLAPLSPPKPERDALIAPLSPMMTTYQLHSCSWTCLSHSPLSVEQQGHNPLRVPLMWGFQRQHAIVYGEGEGPGDRDVFYKAPCGQSLRGPADVLRYMRETEVDTLLHPGNFSFTPAVQLQSGEPTPGGAGQLLDLDLSRGAEPVPVQVWNAVDGARPEKFRYRTHRWPRCCLPPSGPIYSTCCDCTDGCTDEKKCSCLQLSLGAARGAQLYCFRRLSRPVPFGIFECGPWCSCDRARCLNRVVQHGLQVRLQVFRTQHRGWGVRCLDDLDRGTFVCTYTGVVMRAGLRSEGAIGTLPLDRTSVKRKREEQSSDDEVEVVEEWTVPAVETDMSPNPEPPPSPSGHVSVIKRPTGLSGALLDNERAEEESQPTRTESATSPSSGTSHSHLLSAKSHPDTENGEWEGEEAEPWLNSGQDAEEAWLGEGGNTNDGLGVCHSGSKEEHQYYLDATEEGNVGRFLNHSCCPNLFVQNVFIDSHHRDFPTVAFFTSRSVTAGTELTWNYSYDPGTTPEQEVPCQCGCQSCQGALI